MSLLSRLFKKGSKSNDHESIKIGDQVWMAKNLNVSHFRNGDPILEAKSKEEWKKVGDNKQPAWCYYNNDPFNGKKYGKLYNWYTVNDPRGLAPVGWRIPSDAEWTQLIDYLGGEDVAGAKMKCTSEWNDAEYDTNESGFSGMRGGYRNFGGDYYNIGFFGCGWWSSSEEADESVEKLLSLFNMSSDSLTLPKETNMGARTRTLSLSEPKVGRSVQLKGNGFSIRCIRDK